MPFAAVAQQAPAQPPAAQPDVDLKLFETAEVDRSKGCSVALWQANRNPTSDRYAYIFKEALTGREHARQPAQIKIGAQVMNLTRVAVGGRTTGFGLHPYQLYKFANSDDFVILETKLAAEAGQSVEIESGTMSVVMRGKQVFRASVKGTAGCTTDPLPTPAAAAAPVPAPAAPPAAAAAPAPARPAAPPQQAQRSAPPVKPAHKVFERYQVPAAQVPREITDEARKKHDCNPQFMRQGVVAYSLSEEAALWQMTCDRFAYQATSIYAVVYAAAPGSDFEFLTFKRPPGKEPSSETTLMMPKWDVASRTVTGVSLGRGSGDCGTLERHRFKVDRKFELVEFREKENCDGKEDKPESWPLVFRAR
jgi:hypothetical protein